MPRLKTLVRNEAGTPPLRSGHSLCQGCGIPMVVRTVLDKLGPAEIVKREIGTGIPMIYRLNADATVASKLDLAA